MTNLDKSITLMCAQRYALGRMTYVVGSVTSQIIENWNVFSESDKQVMLKEIKEAIEQDRAGMECDILRWNEVIDRAIEVMINEGSQTSGSRNKEGKDGI